MGLVRSREHPVRGAVCGPRNRYLFAPPATFANFTESDSMWISRIASNVKFGYDAVVAKY